MTTAARPAKSRSGTGPAIIAILLISAAATLFLAWLIYIHPAATSSSQYAFLPALNAVFNGLAATALLIGYTFIRAGRIRQHRASMITAFIFSCLFLVGYIAHHALHGDIRYPIHAAFRTFYLCLLASHIILATVALPLVLVTFFFSPAEVRGWSSEQYTSALRHVESAPAYNSSLRQLLHVGFKISAQMGRRYLDLLELNEAVIARNVTENLLARHIAPVFLAETYDGGKQARTSSS